MARQITPSIRLFIRRVSSTKASIKHIRHFKLAASGRQRCAIRRFMTLILAVTPWVKPVSIRRGVGMSATEAIYNGPGGAGCRSIRDKNGNHGRRRESVILPVAQSARQGAKLLGIIEQKALAKVSASRLLIARDMVSGAGSGHQWLAVRLPADSYFVSANQGRFAITIRMITRIIWRHQR